MLPGLGVLPGIWGVLPGVWGVLSGLGMLSGVWEGVRRIGGAPRIGVIDAQHSCSKYTVTSEEVFNVSFCQKTNNECESKMNGFLLLF